MLFTDIEGSTQLTHRLGERYREVVTDHRRLLEEAFKAHDGRIVDRQTESFFAVFPRVGDAARAAAAAQRALAAHPWPDGEQVSVRMGIHAGEPELDGDRYVGLAVSRGARVAASAHGGQVLLSGAAHSLLADQRFSTRRLGSFPLKDFDAPEPLYQLLVEGLPDRFPRPRVEPRRSRRRAVAVAASVLLAVGVVALLAAFMGGSGGGLSGVQANHVGLIDPGTNEIVDEVSVGIKPGPIAFGMGSAWVGNLADRNLTRVDARTRERAGTISLDNQTPTGIAVGGDAVWVAHGPLGKLSRVDPQFGQVTATIDLADPSGAGVVTFGGRAVWAAYGESTLARVDPISVQPTGRGLAGGSPTGIVYARQRLWVANSDDQTVSRFNPATFQEGSLPPITVGQGPAAIAFGANAIWVANKDEGTVTRINRLDAAFPSTETIEVAPGPTAVAYGDGAVWVASESGTVSRIDPASSEVVKEIEVGNAPSGIAVGEGLVWVTVQASPEPAT